MNAPDPMDKKTRKAIARGAFYAIDMSIGGKCGFTMIITLAGAHAAQCHPESTRIHSQADVAQSDLPRSFT